MYLLLIKKYKKPGRFRNLFLLLSLCWLLLPTQVFGQFLGNEWINYSQQYYKFPVTKTSIYHIDSTVLANAGIPLASFDARNLQLFFHGTQVPLYIPGEGDGVLNASDYIEFFGEANNGWLDSALYVNGTADMMNPAYSLFNDTSFYYITWNNSINNLRYTLETDIDFASYTPAPFYMYKVQQGGGLSYYDGEFIVDELYMPEYTAGEGYCSIYSGASSYSPAWTSTALNGFQNTIYTGTPVNSTLQVHVATCNNPNALSADHHHQITVAGILEVDSTNLEGYNFYQRRFTVNSTTLKAASEPFRVNFLNNLSSNTRNAFGYYELNMPQTFDLSSRTEQWMNLPDDPILTKSRLDITNYNAQSSTAWIFDLTNRKKITTVDNAGTLQALVPNDGNSSPKKLYLASDATVTNITQVVPVSTDITHYAQFRDFQSAEANKDYIIITHRSLWNSASLYENLRSYRYNTALVDVEELYDQFGFGIPKHPRSIQNFLKMTNNFWSTKPEHVFIIGKGIKHSFIRQNPTNYAKSLVPAIGIAPCDNMYSYNVTGNGTMYCAIGRLSASSDSIVIDYYNKVLNYEANQQLNPRPEWQKNVLHFSSDPSFQGYINGYKIIIEDTLFGGSVTSFVKNGAPSFLPGTADSIRSFLNDKGVSLVTVFGHSSGQGFDLNVDEPEQMENTGKYPWYIINGCLSGDLFQTTTLISERFVLNPEKGAIGFISSTSVGLAGILGSITSTLYQNIGVDDYYKTMGIAHKNAITDYVQFNPANSPTKINALNFQIHGDPSLKFNADSLPDIDLQVSNVSFDPPVVTMEMDSFKMKVIVTNLGRTITQPYTLTVTRDYPEPGVANAVYNFTRPSIYFKDTVEFYLPVSYGTSFGLNGFHIEADLPSFIVESSGNEFMNNMIDLNLNIISSDIVPVYPYKYAVIPRNHTLLKASTGDPFAPARNYKFQLDTTDLFNSPFLRETVINQSGGVVQWDPGMLLDSVAFDSAAYFWRVGVDSANTGNYYRFKESTFQFITGKYGWGQDHFFQFKDDSYTYIDYNRPARRFDFSPIYKELKVVTYPVPYPGDGNQYNTFFAIDGGIQESSGCPYGNKGIYVFVIDPITLQPWGTNYAGANPGHSFGNAPCRSRVEKYFLFNLGSTASQDSLADMLLNDVPPDYFIGAYTFTFSAPNFSNWSPNLIAAFTALGADSLATLQANSHTGPYIFYTRKGDPTSTQEVVGLDGTTPIELNVTLQNNWFYGTIYSELVGPASEWQSFHWQQHSIDADTSNDDEWVRIIGIQPNGTEDILIDNIQSSTTDIYSLNTLPGFDPTLHPYLKLMMYTRDDSTQTPAQINHWHVMYEGVPECALSPNLGWGYNGDTTYQGQNINFHVSIENIGDYDMDSLQIRYSIMDANNVMHDYYVIRDSLRVGDVLVDTFSISNNNFSGFNTFYVEANPFTSIWQPEQFHFNNIGTRNMMVNGDKLNPLLDVTFDGIHIMDGDIVSGKPLINIQLKDENSLRLLDDTAGFELYLKYPGSSNAVKINFTNPILTFYPAATAQNYAKIELRPDLSLQDGVYQLMIRARDKSGNQSGYGDSGIYDYKIKFEVVNHSTITNIFNYPNPFSTSTQWVFTLTGSEIPTEFTIRIMTISGVVVREITLDELGPIHIGNNISTFKWNGTDEYGDKLATGVYIYQVITKINGETIDHRTTSADKYFKNNFGKLYILR
jgi:hypothetical protein